MSATESSHRLFFALQPDRCTLQALCAIQRRLESDEGRPVPCERLHATLLFMGSQTTASLNSLLDLAPGLEFPPCRLVLDRLGHFSRAAVAWLGPTRVPTELEDFQARLAAAVVAAGIGFDDKPWRMHVTLYRDLRKRPGRIAFEPIEWTLRNFQLMESMHNRSGLEYRCRGRWPSRGSR